ncbi:MAG TPA: 3-dehydroquinate synthase family protein [Bacteriovoracaceae bacterium]|nr:3-dehydroquinate synthase family protein [Bacteriovoracaceae bacterium]
MLNSKITYLKKLELFKLLDDREDSKFFAIADQKTKNHLPQWIQFSPNVFWIKNPEEEKNLDTFARAQNFFISQGIQRDDVLYAFGGGATTDLAGFVAATLLRGIEWVAVPTTLLAMVDAAIGGKVAVNLDAGKNLVGSFYEPQSILICNDFLSSLPEKEVWSGRGEVLKYAFLSSDVYGLIMKKAPLEEIIVECAKFKSRIVERDLREKGERILLNLGHTLGHAFETTLKIPHGLAVAMGMKYIFRFMKLNQSLEEWEKLAKALALPLERLEISYYDNFNIKTFTSFLEQDKKKAKKSIRLVLVKSIGDCYVEEVPLKEFIQNIQASNDFKY